MTPSQKLRSIADSTGLDGIANAIREVANEIDAPAVPQIFQPIETIKYWADAYSDRSSGPHFQGHGMVVTMLREYEQLRTILAATPAAPSQPVTLTDEEIDKAILEPLNALLDHIYEHSTLSEGILPLARKIANAIIAALREKEGK